MLRFTGGLSQFVFDERRFNRDTQRRLTKLAKEAIRDWLFAVLNAIDNAPHTDGDSFPIQTGEAKGSFKPLARLLNQSQISVSLPITPAPGRPNYISRGASQGQVVFQANAGDFHIIFEFSSDVEHFLINEYNLNTRFGPNASVTPWNSFAAGGQAFEDYIHENVERFFPDINDYIIVRDEA